MAVEPTPQAQGAAQATETAEVSLLDQAIGATKQTEPERAQELLRTLTEEALKGTVTYDRNLTVTLNRAIAAIDQQMSRQLAAIMHNEKFRKLEGSWRGLHHLVQSSETSATLKIRVINVSKRDLYRDVSKAVEFDQSQIFKKIYESEFGTPGGEPYGALIGDYEFTNHPEDVELLQHMSQVSAAAFAPFISAAGPQLFGFNDYTELSRPRDLEKIFESQEYAKWRSFRDSEDSRFVTLTMPRALARLPYGASTRRIEEFGYEEAPADAGGTARAMAHDHYCWMNAAYVMGARLTDAFAQYGWCTAIRGAEGGGKVENLPFHTFVSDDGDPDHKCPTEIGITDRREAELSRLGFLPLCHYKNTDYAVFFGAQTTQKPKKYDRPEATANAAISARLPYMMATSRFAHYLKVMARDKVGSFLEASDCEAWLNRWIMNYVNSNKDAGQEMKAKYPLAEAKISVKEIPGSPGAYNAVAWLRPWLQMEELTTSLRMVARIPNVGGNS
jgi:type VI secretion system protein ImpC